LSLQNGTRAPQHIFATVVASEKSSASGLDCNCAVVVVVMLAALVKRGHRETKSTWKIKLINSDKQLKLP